MPELGYCIVCGRRTIYLKKRHAWKHRSPGADHNPIPATPDRLAEKKPPAGWAKRH